MKITKKYYGLFLVGLTFGQSALAQFQAVNPGENKVDLETANNFGNVLHAANVALALVFILSISLLLVSGVYFITAGGDEDVLQNAHAMWRLAALGLGIALIGYIVVNVIKFFI